MFICYVYVQFHKIHNEQEKPFKRNYIIFFVYLILSVCNCCCCCYFPFCLTAYLSRVATGDAVYDQLIETKTQFKMIYLRVYYY